MQGQLPLARVGQRLGAGHQAGLVGDGIGDGSARSLGRGRVQRGRVAVPPAVFRTVDVAHDVAGVTIGGLHPLHAEQLLRIVHGREHLLLVQALVHQAHDFGAQPAQRLCGVQQHLLHGLLALDHGTELAHGLERAQRGHGLQRVGPAHGVAQRAKGRADVGDGVQQRRAAVQHALAGAPQRDGVVGLGRRPEQLDAAVSAAYLQPRVEGFGGLVHVQPVLEKARAAVELDLGHAVLQRPGLAVARLAARQVAVRDEARHRLSARGRMLQPGGHARVVADVAVAVAQRMHGRIAELAQAGDHVLADLAAGAGVDHHQARVGLGHEGLALAAQYVQARRHGFAAGAHQQEGLVVVSGVHGVSGSGSMGGRA